MSKETHSSHHHSALARTLLAIVFLILCAGNFAFWKFSYYGNKPSSVFPAMPGLVVGAALASTAIIAAVWFRNGMARTALIVFIWIIMFVFSMPGLIMMSNRDTVQISQLQILAAGLVCYLIANIVLISAASIHRLGMSRGCRG